MARDFNQIRNTNAKLGEVTITRYGKTWAVQYGFDGANIINNEVLPVPTDIKEYLEGNDNITIFACASNIDKLCEYALASFPSIQELYLFKTSAIVVLEDYLSYLLDLNKIYVPSDLLSGYISAYPTLSSKFDTIVEDYTLIIPFIGDTELTSEYVDSVIAMLSSAEKNAITKVVVPSDFIESVANEVIWSYNFSQYLPNLNNNIWYNTTQYDFSEFTIVGSGELTSAIVENAFSGISVDKTTEIEKIIVPVEFTSYAVGSISAIEDYMEDNSIDKLVTTYSGGAMEIDFQDSIWQEIITRINNKNKTLENTLIVARHFDISNVIPRNYSNKANLLIVPPKSGVNPYQYAVSNSSSPIIYIAPQRFTGNNAWLCVNNAKNGGSLYRLENYIFNDIITNMIFSVYGVNYAKFTFEQGSNESLTVTLYTDYTQCYKLLMFGFTSNLIFQTRTNMDTNAWYNFIDSLGTPTTTLTITIVSTDYNKLNAEIIALANSKNWQIVTA